jgi:hypothetical protein
MFERSNLRYSPELEEIHPEEAQLIEETALHIQSLILKNFNRHSHAFRGTHLKTQGLVKGMMTIRNDLSEDLQQGLFVPGKKYNTIMRYANEPFKIDPDTVPGPRGIGMKVFIDGDKTQDFLMNNAPILELTDVQTTAEIFALRDKYFEDQKGMEKELQKRNDTAKQMAPFQLPNTDIMGMQFYQQAPFRFGPFVGKLSLTPSSKQTSKSRGKVPKDAHDLILREWVTEYYAENDSEYVLAVQFCKNLKTEPVEDTSVDWKTEFHELADLVFPKQDSFSAARRVFWEEKMRLDPWKGLDEHKPVGGVNRVRRGVYGKSREMRQDINRTETTAVSWEHIPD